MNKPLLKDAASVARMPEIPTAKMLEELAVDQWPQDWEDGKRLQGEKGCGVVAPNNEIETAVGKYNRLRKVCLVESAPISIDWLSNVIREADGAHSLGAGALAEKICEAIEAEAKEVKL